MTRPANFFLGWIDRYFLAILLALYALAGILPGPGLAIRAVTFFGHAPVGSGLRNLSLITMMLALQIFIASVNTNTDELWAIIRRPLMLVLGLLANAPLRLAFTLAVFPVLARWHSVREAQIVLVGFAFVASMPIASASAAWSQKSDGNLTLSVGLIVFSTLMSPLLAPHVLRVVGLITTGDYSEDLVELANQGAGRFLAAAVAAPAILGMAARWLVGAKRLAPHRPWMKSVNLLDLLLLNYSNAALTLPRVVAAPDWDFLALILALVAALGAVAFCGGWLLGVLLGASSAERRSLVYGLGMNNNGLGLVLVSLTMPDHPAVMLPIILYNLSQQVLAGCADIIFARSAARGSSERDRPPDGRV